MKNYTKIPNEIFEDSQLSSRARFLFCVLLKFCGKNDSCFPGQKKLAKILGCSDRYIRTIINELASAKLINIKRVGFNKSNTYKVSKDLYRNNSSDMLNQKDGNNFSSHLGSAVPLSIGISIPDNSTYIKEKDKNNEKSLRALEKCRVELIKKGVISPKKDV